MERTASGMEAGGSVRSLKAWVGWRAQAEDGLMERSGMQRMSGPLIQLSVLEAGEWGEADGEDSGRGWCSWLGRTPQKRGDLKVKGRRL